MLKLHVFPPSPRAFKVLALAEHLGLPYQQCLVDFSQGDHRKPEYKSLNPNQRMPVLEEDGYVLWESHAILQYLASKKPDSGLLPRDERERANVTRWQCWDLAHWEPACVPLIYERMVKRLFNLGEPDSSEIAKGLSRFEVVAGILDEQLQKHRFVAGEKLSVADFSLGAALNVARLTGMPIEKRPAIRRWHAELSELPAWRKLMPTVPR